MLSKAEIQIFRCVTTVMVLTPLFIHLVIDFSILAILMYLPLLSASIAIVCRYIDHKMILSIQAQQQFKKIANVLKVSPLTNKPYPQKAA